MRHPRESRFNTMKVNNYLLSFLAAEQIQRQALTDLLNNNINIKMQNNQGDLA